MQVGEAGKDQRVTVGQRTQHPVVVELCATTLVLVGVERNHNADIGALVVMPSTLLLVLGIVICDLDRCHVRTIPLVQHIEDWVQHVLDDKPHIAIQLGHMVLQDNLGNLSQHILLMVGYESYFPFHVLDLFDQHLAKLPTKQWHSVNVWEYLFAELRHWRFPQTVHALSGAVLRYQRNAFLHGLVQRLIYHPMRLHR